MLTGKVKFSDALIAGAKGLAGHGVVFERNAVCTAIDANARTVATQGGKTYSYDALVLATGSFARELPPLPLGMPRVHYLRTEAHAHALKVELEKAKKVVIVGAGLIGLEVASSARTLGVDTIVLEVAPRILARVTDEENRRAHPKRHTLRTASISVSTPACRA